MANYILRILSIWAHMNSICFSYYSQRVPNISYDVHDAHRDKQERSPVTLWLHMAQWCFVGVQHNEYHKPKELYSYLLVRSDAVYTALTSSSRCEPLYARPISNTYFCHTVCRKSRMNTRFQQREMFSRLQNLGLTTV